MRSYLFAILLLAAGCGGSKAAPGDYYVEVEDVAARGPKLDGHVVKVRGYVVPGSIAVEVVGGNTVRRFVLEQHGMQVAVELRGPAPDALRDRAEVVASGTLHHDGDAWAVDADEVLAKCPDRYGKSAGTNPYR